MAQSTTTVGTVDFGMSAYQEQTTAQLRTALAAVSGTTFTSARMDAMTVNDMVYALKVGTGSGWKSPVG